MQKVFGRLGQNGRQNTPLHHFELEISMSELRHFAERLSSVHNECGKIMTVVFSCRYESNKVSE